MSTQLDCDICLDLFEKHDIIHLEKGFRQKIAKLHPDKNASKSDIKEKEAIFIKLNNCKDYMEKDMHCKSRFENKNSSRRRQEEIKREEKYERERQERERREREQEEMLGRLPKILRLSEAEKLQLSNEERKKKNRENIERLKKNIRSKRKSKEEKRWRLPKILRLSEAEKLQMSNEERKKKNRENIERSKRNIRTKRKSKERKEKGEFMRKNISARKIQEMFRARSLYTELNKKIKEEEKAASKIKKSYRKSKFRKSIKDRLKKIKMHKELKEKNLTKSNRYIRRLSRKLSRQQLSKIREESKRQSLNDMDVIMERFSKMNLKRKRSSASSTPKHKRSRLRG